MMMTMMMMIMMMMMVMMDGDDDDDDDDDDDGDDAQNFYLGFDIVPAIFWRIPKLSEKDATSLLPPEGVDFENTSGIGLQALQDFQKLYGCKQVVDEDKPMESFSVQEERYEDQGHRVRQVFGQAQSSFPDQCDAEDMGSQNWGCLQFV